MTLLKCIIMTLIVKLIMCILIVKCRKESCVCKYKNAYYLICYFVINVYNYLTSQKFEIEMMAIFEQIQSIKSKLKDIRFYNFG